MYANTPDGRAWFARQIAGLITKIGSQMGVPLTPETIQRLYPVALAYAQNNIIPGLPGPFQGQVANGLAQAGASGGIPPVTSSTTSGANAFSPSTASLTGGTTTASGSTMLPPTSTTSTSTPTFGGASYGFGVAPSRAVKETNPRNFGGFVPVQ